MRKVNVKELQNIINNLYNNKYLIISEYKNNNTEISIKCKNCNYIDQITPKHLKKGTYQCRGCGFNLYPLSLKDLDGEDWLPIQGFSNYLISNKGRVKILSHKALNSNIIIKEEIKKFSLKPSGYIEGELRDDDGKRHWVSMHRLVAQAFVLNPDPNNYFEVNHIDGNKSNNCFDNLEWTNRQKNIQHSFNTNLHDFDQYYNQCIENSIKAQELSRKYQLIEPKTNKVIKIGNITELSLFTGLKNCSKTYKKYLDVDVLYRGYYWKTV